MTYASWFVVQVVEVDGNILEKPADANHAASMLRR